MAAFPAYPLLMFEGFEEQPQPAVLRSEFETGPPKQQPMATLTMIQRPVAYILTTNADFLSFKTFVQATLNMGADWFDWTDPADSQVKPARIVGGFGGIRFEPTRKNLSRWVARFQLETYG